MALVTQNNDAFVGNAVLVLIATSSIEEATGSGKGRDQHLLRREGRIFGTSWHLSDLSPRELVGLY